MRFIRLAIRNYRGVEAATVDFAEQGITVVQGPNEAGKTSLAEAVRVLFEHKATTDHQSVKALKRVGADAGTEVELEAVSGPYHFVYKKVFNKPKEATLAILAPAPANYSGGEAHDQANRILDETLDKALWDALTIRQGNAIGLPDVDRKTGLMAALDRAAGQNAAEQNEAETLFARVEAEYAHYHTKTGKPGAMLVKAEDDAAGAKDAADDLAARLEAVEAAGDRLAARRAILAKQNASLAALSGEHREFTKAAAEIAGLTGQLNQRQLALGPLAQEFQTREHAGLERERMIRAVDRLERELCRLQADVETERPRVADREETLRDFGERLAEAEAARRQSGDAVAAARADYAYLRGKNDLGKLVERKQGVDAARAAQAAARADMDGNVLTDALYQEIKDAELALAKADVLVRANAPDVTIRGLGECTVTVDGEELVLAKGESRQFSVGDLFRLEVPEALAVVVTPGSETAAPVLELRKARERFDRLCGAAGVGDSREALARLQQRQAAENIVAAKREAIADFLRGDAYEDIVGQILRLEESVPPRKTLEEAERLLPGSLDTARLALEEAERRHADADAARERAMLVFGEEKNRADQAATRQKDLLVEKAILEKQQAQAASELAVARAEITDEDVAALLEKAKLGLAEGEKLVHALEAVLATKNVDQVTAMEKTLAESIAAKERDIAASEKEIAALEAELRARGDEDLFERWQNAAIAADDLAERYRDLAGKAAAARLLYETMRTERDRTRKAYVAPLQQKVEELGRYLFNPTFRANLDEKTLALASRTLDGVTIPFASLSGGTREQLSIVYRAACAILVAEREGMPLILDDPLGYTDDRRLRYMGAVLAKAAEQCQIVVFTCLPERFANIGAAKVVRLE